MRDRLGWTVAALSGWLVGGAYLDAWAHRNRPGLESFFTPWHGVLYSGFAAVSAYLLWRWWERELPQAYRLSLWGSAVFAFGGLADMVWHAGLGVEVGLEAPLSPTHLTLGLGAGLIVTGPLRSAWRSGQADWPAVLSATWLLSVITYFTQFGHPFVEVLAARPGPDRGSIFSVAGVEAILLQSLVLVGLVVLLASRLPLPSGSLLVLIGLSGLLLASLERDWLMAVTGMVAGLLAEALASIAAPWPPAPSALRTLAAGLPVAVFGPYLGVVAFTAGVGWTLEVWVGSLLMAGLAGWLASYAVFPPATSAHAEARPDPAGLER